jgi:hypothetical protein
MIRLTLHAQEWIARRGLDVRWVEATVLQPDYSLPNPADPALTRSWRSIPEFGGRMLRVVHRPDGGDVVVITAYFDRGAKR